MRRIGCAKRWQRTMVDSVKNRSVSECFARQHIERYFLLLLSGLGSPSTSVKRTCQQSNRSECICARGSSLITQKISTIPKSMLAFTALKTLCKKRCSKNWVSKRLSKVEAPGTITPRGFFIMYCEACGTQLPLGAKACPNCGTLTPAYYADSSVSPHDSTQAASGSSFDALVAPPPSSTQYGTNQYDASLQNPYEVNPYTAPAPPPQPPRKVSPAMLGILIVLVLLIAGASVGFVLLRNNQVKANLPPSVTSGPTRDTDNAAVNATATATAFYSLYDTDTSSSLPTKNDPLSNNTHRLQC